MDGISLDTALLFKYFRGLTTGGERKRVEDWMQISEENEKTVLQAARIFYISQTLLRISFYHCSKILNARNKPILHFQNIYISLGFPIVYSNDFQFLQPFCIVATVPFHSPPTYLDSLYYPILQQYHSYLC